MIDIQRDKERKADGDTKRAYGTATETERGRETEI